MIANRNRAWASVAVMGAIVLAACAPTATSLQPAASATAIPASKATWNYIDPSLIDPAAVLPAPAPGAPTIAFEGGLVSSVQTAASPGMRAFAKQADSDSPCDLITILDPSIGQETDAKQRMEAYKAKYPRICDLLIKANADSEEAKKAAKAAFKRQRPAQSGWTTVDSYPSGHATRAAIQVTLLASIASEKERELIKEAWFRGLCRLTLGVHFPTDVTAGYVFGEVIARRMLEQGNDAFKADLKAAQDEWASMRR